MNTVFRYMYRDASNYKRAGEVIFTGAPTPEIEERIRKALSEAEYFVAHAVAVPEAFFCMHGYESYEDDHAWHEFCNIAESNDTVNDVQGRTIEVFVESLEKAAKIGWDKFLFDPLEPYAVENRFNTEVMQLMRGKETPWSL